jgi:hypothetical protein
MKITGYIDADDVINIEIESDLGLIKITKKELIAIDNNLPTILQITDLTSEQIKLIRNHIDLIYYTIEGLCDKRSQRSYL